MLLSRIAPERVKHISNGDQASDDRNVVPMQSVRVSVPSYFS
jgi:hypothetical protein